MTTFPRLIEAADRRGDGLHGVVITTDTFGNVITNIDRRDLDTFSAPLVRAGGHDIPLRRTYGDVAPGDLIALINSYDVLEIARAEQSASELLGIGPGSPVLIIESAK